MGDQYSYPWDKDGGGDTPYSYLFEQRRLRAMYPYSGRLVGSGDGTNKPLWAAQSSPTSLAIRVNTGMYYMNGSIYELQTSVEVMTHDQELSGSDRIDICVVQRINANQNIRLAIKKGDPAGSPVAPTVTQDGSTWEEILYEVYITNGVTALTDANITNYLEWAYPVGVYVGQISYSPSITVEEHQLVCDGSTFKTGEYPRLAALLGTNYNTGGEAAGEARLPDYRGKVILGYNDTDLPNGKDTTLSTREQGDTGGEEEHTPIEAEMFAHSHSVTARVPGGGSVSVEALTDGTSASNFNTSGRGSSSDFNVMNPYGVAVPIINT